MAELASPERFADLEVIDCPVLGLKLLGLVDCHLFYVLLAGWLFTHDLFLGGGELLLHGHLIITEIVLMLATRACCLIALRHQLLGKELLLLLMLLIGQLRFVLLHIVVSLG